MDIAFRAGAIIGEYIFYSDNRCNALMRYDLNNDLVEYIREFPADDLFQDFLHKNCIVYKNKCFFTPNMSKFISVFDSSDNSIESIPVPRIDNSRFCFGDAVLWNNKIYVIPGNTFQSLIIVDIDSYEVEERRAFCELLNEKPKLVQSIWKVCVYNDRIIIPLIRSNKVIVYDLRTDKERVIELKTGNVCNVFCCDNNLFLSTYESKIYKWEIDDNILNEIDVEDKEILVDGSVFFANEELFLFPLCGEKLLVYQGDKFVNIETKNKKCSKDKAHNPYYETYDKWKNGMVLFPNNGGSIIVIRENEIINKHAVCSENDVYKKRYLTTMKIKNKNTIFEEDNMYSFYDFLNALLDCDNMPSERQIKIMSNRG